MYSIHHVKSIPCCKWIDSKELATWEENLSQQQQQHWSCETTRSWTMNTLRLWVVFAIVAPDPIVPPLLMIMSAVMGLRGVCVCASVCTAFQPLCAPCVYHSRVPETRGDPLVSLLVQSRDNTLWRRCSLIIPFKRTERNPSSHPLLLLLLLPSPPLPPPLCSTDAP